MLPILNIISILQYILSSSTFSVSFDLIGSSPAKIAVLLALQKRDFPGIGTAFRQANDVGVAASSGGPRCHYLFDTSTT